MELFVAVVSAFALGTIIGIGLEKEEGKKELLKAAKIKDPVLRETTGIIEIKISDGKFAGFVDEKVAARNPEYEYGRRES
ncbi:MAG: hypothetical protein AAB388_00960 [Patescibacteria group bacterium]